MTMSTMLSMMMMMALNECWNVENLGMFGTVGGQRKFSSNYNSLAT